MAENSMLTKPRRVYLRWLPEEDRVLLDAWHAWQLPSGRARDGYTAHILSLFPHRKITSIRHRMDKLVEQGKEPKWKDRERYTPLDLSIAEAAWLAGIIDGEGGVGNPFRAHGTIKDSAISVTLCANTDLALLERVRQLVPFNRLYVNRPSGPDCTAAIKTRKTCYVFRVTGQIRVLDVLNNGVPYLSHGVKRQRALRLQEWLKVRLRRPDGAQYL